MNASTQARRARVAARVARKAILPAAVLWAGLAAGTVSAEESIWGMEALGRPLPPLDLAARGAGGAAVAIDDPFAMSGINPASLARAQRPQLQIGAIVQDRWIKAEAQDDGSRRLDARLSGLAAVFPLRGPLRAGLAFRDLTDATYAVKVRLNEGREDQFDRTLSGKGGVSELCGVLAAALADGRVAAGLHLGFLQGSMTDERIDRYVAGPYEGGKDQLRTRVRDGIRLGAGMQARLGGRVTAGASWRSAAELDLSGRWYQNGVELWSEKAQFDYPASAAIGLAVRATPRLRLAADWAHEGWGSSGLSGSSGAASGDAPAFGGLEDADRISVGLTRFPPVFEGRAPLVRRLTWRAGFSWQELAVAQRGGARPVEWAASAGLGVPVQIDRGSFDLLLEVGRTGDLEETGVRETFVRFGAGYTVSRLASAF